MHPSRPFDVCFVRSINHVSIICYLIAIVTETKDFNEFSGKRSVGMIDRKGKSRDILTFTNSVMPICPPPNNLHLFCDVTFVSEHVICSERAFLINHCLNSFEGIYVKSNWSVCDSDLNPCLDISVVLRNKGYITSTSNLHSASSERYTDTFTPESAVISSQMEFGNGNSNATITLLTSTTAYHDANNVTLKDTTVAITTAPSTIGSDSGGGITAEYDEEEPLSATYIYALIGILVVLIEIAILFIIYFYLRKRQRSRPYRHPSKESLCEEIIAAETTSPTQALVLNNLVYDDEDIFKQDQKIYQSYLNLRYIDDSSVECTPEKTILK